MWQKIANFYPNCAFPDCNSSLNSPMAMKCCTKLETAKEICPIVFQVFSKVKLQGHTGQNIIDFDPNCAFPDYRPVAAFKSLRFALFYVSTLCRLSLVCGFMLTCYDSKYILLQQVNVLVLNVCHTSFTCIDYIFAIHGVYMRVYSAVYICNFICRRLAIYT